MRTTKINKRTLPKRKAKVVAKPAAKKNKVKVKPKYNLKGVLAKYKVICNLAIEHAETQTQCHELLLVGVNAYETLFETNEPEIAEKMVLAEVTKAILLKKESYPPIVI